MASGLGRLEASRRLGGPRHAGHLGRLAPGVRCPAFLDVLKGAFTRSEPQVDTREDLDPGFTQWIKSQGGEVDKVSVQLCGREGRGLVARQRIRRGERVLFVPGHLVIDADTAAAGSSLRGVLSRQPRGAAGGLSEWDMIAVFLTEIHQHYWQKQQQQQQQQQQRQQQQQQQQRQALDALRQTLDSSRSSPGQRGPQTLDLEGVQASSGGGGCAAEVAAVQWAPYLAVLPTTTDTVLDWTPQQVHQRLAGSPLLRRALALQQAARATWAEVQPLVREAEQAGEVRVGVISEDGLRWSLGIMLSRLVQLSSRDCTGLVPFCDLANHSPASTAHLDWQAGTVTGSEAGSGAGSGGGSGGDGGGGGGVTLIADRDYAPGEQVYISYGERSSGELLLSYGFTPPDLASHPHESVTVTVGLGSPQEDPLQAQKAELLALHGLPLTCDFPLRLDGLHRGLMPWAAFCAPSSSLPPDWQDAALLLTTLLPSARPATATAPATAPSASAAPPAPAAAHSAATSPQQQQQRPAPAASAPMPATGRSARGKRAARGGAAPAADPAAAPPQGPSDPQGGAAVTSLVELEAAHARLVAACCAPGPGGVGVGARVGAGAEGELPGGLQEAALREVAAVCSAALKGYPTTLDQDREAASKASEGEGLTAVCAAIRVRERQILARTEFVVSSQAREMARSSKKRAR